ncbi:hypothetical protein [Actinospongicola halichondriae]|uniref:hypothetical protein n=1 Tax=Actinospongicola halichondriae TaxID=3236844 RepID=UPI003D581330
MPPPPPLPAEAPRPAATFDDTPGDGVADADAVDEIRRRAMLHSTEQTRTYPCLQCGGELMFDIGVQKLKCPHCGNVQEIIEDEGNVVAEQDFRAALAALRSGAIGRDDDRVAGDKEVVCQNCGGHTTFSGSLTATRCPYCATPIQRDDVHDAPARLPVDGVLPFQVDEKTAKTAIDKWISSRWFAPSEFKKYSTTGSFSSVYAAYFTYDAFTTTQYRGQRGDNYTVTVGSGENRRTETRTRWTPRSGVVRDTFDDLPVLANEGFERRRMDALEPWPTGEAKAFSAEYIAGHLCRTYDHDVEECFGSAKQRMDEEIKNTVRRDIGGDKQRISSMSVHYDQLSYKHLLLPIWLLTVIYQQKPFQVFINGMTGEVQGQRPWSKVKIAVAVVAALIVIAILVVVFGGSGAEPQ